MPVITSAGNSAVKAARKLRRRAGRSKAGDAFLVDGAQALAEALPHLRRAFVAESASGSPAHRRLLAAQVETLVVSDDLLADLATAVTPAPVVGVAVLAEPALDVALAGAGLAVVLHQVRDPGNAGTAVRSADAAGADAVVLTRGSVDPRNPKAVRASAGSLFHLPVVDDASWSDVVTGCRRRGLQLVACDAAGTVAHSDADLAGPTALVFGSEAAGLPGAVLDACDVSVRVPLHRRDRPGFAGSAESLNLAAAVAVITFEAARQRRERAHAPAPSL